MNIAFVNLNNVVEYSGLQLWPSCIRSTYEHLATLKMHLKIVITD